VIWNEQFNKEERRINTTNTVHTIVSFSLLDRIRKKMFSWYGSFYKKRKRKR